MKLLIIVALAYVLFIHSLGNISLWDPDEPRQAIMAREMVERSDYIHPYLNGMPYLEKPPLHPWLIVLASKIQGRLDEFSSRIPSAVAAAMLLIITFFLGRRLVDEQSGFLSALVLATNYQVLSNARESVMDMTFAFFIALSIFLAYSALVRQKRWLFALSFFPSALAILTKGPAGLVIPAGVLFLLLLTRREVKKFIGPLAAGCLFSLACASVWFFLAGPEYAKEFLLRQNVTRYATGFDHVEPFYYYFHKLFFNFLPWSILLPFAVYHSFKKRAWLPLIWFLFTFIFFDFSKSKRAIYLLSAYPACALLVGMYLRDFWRSLVEGRVTSQFVKAIGALLVLLPLAAFGLLFYVREFRELFQGNHLYPSLLLCLLAAMGLAFLFAVRNKVPKQSLALFFLYLTLSGVLFHSYYMPVVDTRYKSVRLITDQLKGVDGANATIYTYGFNSAALIFYVGRPIGIIRNPGEIAEDKHGILVIAENRHGLPEQFSRSLSPVKEIQYEKETYTILVRKNEG